MPKLILTFDYELFLGEDSGTTKNSILKPTEEIIKLLKKYNAKAIFFVDITYLMALERFEHKDLNLILEQLNRLQSIGSSIELHLHPQWLDATPNGDRWHFKTFDRYRLHSLNSNDIEKIFDDSIEFLQKYLGVTPKVFRAGGWSISPFSSLKKSFIKHNIQIDMSAIKGFYKEELPMHYYDFREAPQKEFYRFENDVTKELKDGTFLEVPVTTFYMYGFDLVINNIINKLKKERYYGDGKGLNSVVYKENILKRVFSQNLRKATIENQSFYMFEKSLNKLKNKEVISYVMHPKTLSATSLKNFEYLLQNYETLNSDDIQRDFL